MLLCVATTARAAPLATFAMVPKSGSPFYQPCYEGFSAAAAKYGVEVRRVDPLRQEAAAQAEAIARLVADHVDGIAVSAIDDAGVAPAIAAAARAGIPVVTFDSPAPSSAALGYIGTDNRAAGAEAGKRLSTLMKGSGKVLVLQGGLAAANLNLRTQGLRDGLGRGVKVLEVVDIAGDDAAAAAKTAAALRAHPDATAVFSISSAGAAAAAEAIAGQGRTGKVLVAGFDDRPGTLEGIRRGAVSFCVVQKTFKMGWLSVRALLEAAAGRKPPRSVDTGVVFVTSANVATYVDEMRSEVTRRR
jgi:ribose transport system substrate-binding protein